MLSFKEIYKCLKDKSLYAVLSPDTGEFTSPARAQEGCSQPCLQEGMGRATHSHTHFEKHERLWRLSVLLLSSVSKILREQMSLTVHL